MCSLYLVGDMIVIVGTQVIVTWKASGPTTGQFMCTVSGASPSTCGKHHVTYSYIHIHKHRHNTQPHTCTNGGATSFSKDVHFFNRGVQISSQ